MKWRFRKTLLFLLAISPPAWSAVFDGGSFSSSKTEAQLDPSVLGPDLFPSNHPVNDFSSVPLGKPFYVLGQDQKCYWGNFSETKKTKDKILVVYFKSSVSAEHCIYQEGFSLNPSGVSVSLKNGGECVPTLADVGDGDNWIIKENGTPVPLISCFDNKSSYGDHMDRKREKSTNVQNIQTPETQVVETQPRLRGVEDPIREPSSIDPKYTLQVSSHLVKKEALEEIEELKTQGVKAYVFETIVRGKARFRVCSGTFSTVKRAKEVALQMGLKTYFVQVLPTNPKGH